MEDNSENLQEVIIEPSVVGSNHQSDEDITTSSSGIINILGAEGGSIQTERTCENQNLQSVEGSKHFENGESLNRQILKEEAKAVSKRDEEINDTNINGKDPLDIISGKNSEAHAEASSQVINDNDQAPSDINDDNDEERESLIANSDNSNQPGNTSCVGEEDGNVANV